MPLHTSPALPEQRGRPSHPHAAQIVSRARPNDGIGVTAYKEVQRSLLLIPPDARHTCDERPGGLSCSTTSRRYGTGNDVTTSSQV